jgi:hypothetical protein
MKEMNCIEIHPWPYFYAPLINLAYRMLEPYYSLFEPRTSVTDQLL